MKKTHSRNVFAIIFAILLGCVFLLGVSFNCFTAFASESEEDKPRCSATLDDEFTDDSVIVTLEQGVGGINKRHSADFFKGVEVVKIVDLIN